MTAAIVSKPREKRPMVQDQLHIALAGNPNCGKTTLFNLITGQNGYVGNWPGVTVEKKEAPLLRDSSTVVCDLPGIYSLSPYSPEERVSRDYLLSGEADVVVQVIDATNLERNLYLALQVLETGLPTVVALNMTDLVEKNGDRIDATRLERSLGCPVVQISALKNRGVDELLVRAREAAGAPRRHRQRTHVSMRPSSRCWSRSRAVCTMAFPRKSGDI